MILVMGITLYTSRVILSALGVEDFGIFNVVAGIVTILGFINTSLSGASSRYITFALGTNDNALQDKTFSTVVLIHVVLACIIILIGETIGLWFIYNKLVIPSARLNAAIWVYHLSILTAVISIISVPYNSLIIAHENMFFFAYISIIEVVLKLIIAFLIGITKFDKLIIYALLLFITQCIIRVMYSVYCKRKFKEANTKFVFDKSLAKEIFIYAGWTFNGNLAVVGYTQGINVLLNIYFGPIVNAARGISMQVNNAANQFVSSFLVAMNPQIIKSYAENDLQRMHFLVINASKYGYFLTLLIVVPLVCCIKPLLSFWLEKVPEFTSQFCVIMLLSVLIEPLSQGLGYAIHATGDIKKYQIYEGTILLLVVPIAYILIKLFSINPVRVVSVYLFIAVLAQCARIYVVLPKIYMKFKTYFRYVLLPLVIPSMLSSILMITIRIELCHFISLLIYVIALILVTIILILYTGFNKDERGVIISYLIQFVSRIRKR